MQNPKHAGVPVPSVRSRHPRELPNRALLRRCASAAALALLASFSSAQADCNYEESDLGAIFVPNELVPLSEFKNATGGVQIVLQVHPDVLAATRVLVAHQDMTVTDKENGPFTLLPATTNLVAGTVTVTPGTDGRVVVVPRPGAANKLRNQFPIVTHWDGGLPGGFCQDGVAGMGKIEFGVDPGNPGLEGFYMSGDSYIDPHPDFSDPLNDPMAPGWDPANPPGRMFRYASDTYAVFSDGSGLYDTADVPGYERYIGENWSVVEVSPLAAIRLSDMSRCWTGRPIAHRNPTPAFGLPTLPLCTGQLPSSTALPLSEGLPVMQVVHAYLVDYDDSTPGRENQLATFVVPPMWTAPTGLDDDLYPVLFSAAYDIHSSLFQDEPAAEWLIPIGNLANEAKPVIGVITNSGAGFAGLAQHASIYPGTAQLFDEAEVLLGVDRDRVVATGGSRGATAALGLAAHPDTFTAQYVSAGNPTTYAAETIELHANPTYGLVAITLDIFSGYVGSWDLLRFEAPSTIDGVLVNGSRLTAENCFGTRVYADIDANLSNGAPGKIAQLVAKGTRIELLASTHDYAKPFDQMTKYYEDLLDAGGADQTRFSVIYRAGHGGLRGSRLPLTDLLRRTYLGDHTAFFDPTNPTGPKETGEHFFHAATPADVLLAEATEFVPNGPSEIPVVLEAPFQVAAVYIDDPNPLNPDALIADQRQFASFTVSGPAGMEYMVAAFEVDKDEWLDGTPVADISISVDPGCDTPPLDDHNIVGVIPASILPNNPGGPSVTARAHTWVLPDCYDPNDEASSPADDTRFFGLFVLYNVPGDPAPPAGSYYRMAHVGFMDNGSAVTPGTFGVGVLSDAITPIHENFQTSLALAASTSAVMAPNVDLDDSNVDGSGFELQKFWIRTNGLSTDCQASSCP